MKEEILTALNNLTGMPLWKAGRASDLHWFIFGEKRKVKSNKGKIRIVGEFALHISCAWRLCTNEHVIVASRDRYYPPGEFTDYAVPSDFEWDAMPQNNRFDQRMRDFLAEHKSQFPIVQKAEVGIAGYARLVFSKNIFLEIFPDDSFPGENWRLFVPNDTKSHFVVTGNGIEKPT